MAAISGILRFDAATTAAADATAVAASMRHRSPDGIECWDGGAVALAHGALWTTPEDQGVRQPVEFGQRWVMVMDGRIDDRDSLASELELAAADAARLSDAQLLSAAWLRWREDCVQHVLGDFALAVWDRQSRQLFLVRDRLGVRPLYYVRTPRLLAFASEHEALLTLVGIDRQPNDDWIAAALMTGFDLEDTGATCYRAVRRLLPGHWLKAHGDGTVSDGVYWQMRSLPELQLRDEAEYVEAFDEVFSRAVRCRMRSQSRPALMLSGGMDSASVWAASRRLTAAGDAAPLRPISIVDQASRSQESRNILQMLTQAGDDAIRIGLPAFDGPVDVADLAQFVYTAPHAVDNSLPLPAMVYLAAARSGSRVVLDGADGDLVSWSPNNYLVDVLAADGWRAAWGEARAASKVHTYLAPRSPGYLLARAMGSRLQPAWLKSMRERLAVMQGQDPIGRSSLHPAFARELRLRTRLFQAVAQEYADRRQDIQSIHVGVMAPTGIMRGMEGLDRVAARFGVEPRHPWADTRLVEFFQRLPLRYKVRHGWTKYLVRSACAPVLGEAVAWHSGKQHFGPLLRRQLIDQSGGWLALMLQRSMPELRRVLAPAELEHLKVLVESGGIDFPSNRDMVLDIAVMGAWITGSSERPVT